MVMTVNSSAVVGWMPTVSCKSYTAGTQPISAMTSLSVLFVVDGGHARRKGNAECVVSVTHREINALTESHG